MSGAAFGDTSLDASVRRAAEAWAVIFAKSRVVRREVPLGFEPADYADEDYDAVADYMAPYREQAANAPVTRSGLRWRYVGDAVLFEFGRVLNAGYDDLVARVDIASAIRLMNDYVGGCSVVVSRDPAGRITRQAERNVYLPQPNWLALSGGSFIDVCKLEAVEYGAGWRRIDWRTISSPNGSAVHDDGTVLFECLDRDRTRVTVCGLQQFTLPPFWAATDPWLPPPIKDALVEDAYRRFFSATLDNIEACYEGRAFRIGRDVSPADEEPWADQVERSWRMLRDVLSEGAIRQLLRSWPQSTTPAPDEVDEHGFRHFSPDHRDGLPDEPAWWRAVRSWQDELRQVVKDDLGTAGTR